MPAQISAGKHNSGQFGGILNESYSDPVLRTFRRPLIERLRERLDDYRSVIDAQASTLTTTTRTVARLERDLARSRRSFARALRLLASTDDAHYRADVRDFISRHENKGGEESADATDDVNDD